MSTPPDCEDEYRVGRVFYFFRTVNPPQLCEVSTDAHVTEIMTMGQADGNPVIIYTEERSNRKINGLLEG